MRNLKKLRKERRLTQIAVKIATGIDQGHLSKYEHGERIPSTNDLIVLADFFKTNIDYLLDRTDVSDPLPPKRVNDEPEKE